MPSIISIVLSFLLLQHATSVVAAHPLASTGTDLVVRKHGHHHHEQRSSCNFPTGCPATCSNGIATFSTPIGPISGLVTSDAIRFTVKYATAGRFQPPQLLNYTQSFSQSTTLPPLCPQSGVDPSTYSEDCLYFVVYAPTNFSPVTWSGGAPVLVWIHGGSYSFGSASNTGLDGSKLAKATGSIVVVVQYRLGILGYLPPAAYSANKNLGVRDVITALQYIQNVIGAVGGDKTKVTVAGQSSGANLIRNLIASPSASSLFSKAILHSDPITYGFLSTTTFTNYQTAYYNTVSCGDCLTTPVATLLAAQDTFEDTTAVTIDPAGGPAQPIRPVKDGSLIQYSLTGTSFPAANKPMLITTVHNEAGTAIYKGIPFTVPTSWYDTIGGALFTASRAALIDSEYQVTQAATDDIRPELVDISTDGAWRCPGYTLARQWAAFGGMSWVGEFTVGATYPVNANISYCTASGHVCHQDDIYILFGTTPNPTAAQTALTAQVQARWGAFINTGNPNTSGYANWVNVRHDGTVTPQNLGGTSSIPIGACDPSVWGASIPYDYQIYNQ